MRAGWRSLLARAATCPSRRMPSLLARAATREPGPPSPPTDSVAAGGETGAVGETVAGDTATPGAPTGTAGETGARDETAAGQQADGSDGTGDHGDSASAPAASGF